MLNLPKSWGNSNKGFVNLETDYFEGDSAFKFLELSRMQRLYGFFGCLIIGFVLSILGAIMLALGQLVTFASLYGIGTVVSLISTGFVIGFWKQLKTMFNPVRVVATIILLVSIALVFIGAFLLHSGVLCIIFVVVEYVAFTWYALSYIPYARAAAKNLIGMA